MTDIDQLARQLRDHEKRLNRVEAKMDSLSNRISALLAGVGGVVSMGGSAGTSNARPEGSNGGWCLCGRDVCRAPDCPSHKTDPMGR